MAARREWQRGPDEKEANLIAQLFIGFLAGVFLVAAELMVFAWPVVFAVLYNQPLQQGDQSPVLAVYFSLAPVLLALTGFLNYILLGRIRSEFTCGGFILGDLALVLAIGSAVFQISPFTVAGLAIALAIVILGFFVRLFEKDILQWGR